MFLYTSELVPTVIRCSCFGALSAIGRIGSVLGSQILKLNDDETPWVSGVVFGALTLLAALVIFTLPETHRLPMTQTLDEAEFRFNDSTKPTKYKAGLNLQKL